MHIKLTAIALLAVIAPGQAGAAMLSDAEASFLDQLATAARGARTTMHRL
ncbi:hypothetical protein [Bradyrhizobium sp. USDA 3256]